MMMQSSGRYTPLGKLSFVLLIACGLSDCAAQHRQLAALARSPNELQSPPADKDTSQPQKILPLKESQEQATSQVILTMKGRLHAPGQAPFQPQSLHLAILQPDGSLMALVDAQVQQISEHHWQWTHLPAPLPEVIVLVAQSEGKIWRQVLFVDEMMDAHTLVVEPFSAKTMLWSEAMGLALSKKIWSYPHQGKKFRQWMHTTLIDWLAEQPDRQQALLAWLHISQWGQQVVEQTLTTPLLGIHQGQWEAAEQFANRMRVQEWYGLSLIPSVKMPTALADETYWFTAYKQAGIDEISFVVSLGAMRLALRPHLAQYPVAWAIFFSQEIDRIMALYMYKAMQRYMEQQPSRVADGPWIGHRQAQWWAHWASQESAPGSQALCSLQEIHRKSLQQLAGGVGLTANQWRKLSRVMDTHLMEHRLRIATRTSQVGEALLFEELRRSIEDVLAAVIAQISLLSPQGSVQHVGQARQLVMVALMLRLGCPDRAAPSRPPQPVNEPSSINPET